MAKVKGEGPAPNEFDGLQGAGQTVAGVPEEAYDTTGEQEPTGDPLEEQFGIPSFKLNEKEETEEVVGEGEGEEAQPPSPSDIPNAAKPSSRDVTVDQASIDKLTNDWVAQQNQQPQMSQQLMNQLAELQKLTGSQPTPIDLKILRQQILERSGNDTVLTDSIMHTVEQIMPIVTAQIQYESAVRAANLIQVREGIMQATQQIRDAFYTANPDLKGFENVVGYMSNQYERLYPNASKEQLMPLIAQASRQQITELKKQLGYQPSKSKKGGPLGSGPRAAKSVPQPTLRPQPGNGKGNISREEKTQSSKHLDDLVDFVTDRGFVS